DLRHRGARERAGGRRIDRHGAPAEQALSLLADRLLEDLEALVALEDVARQEHHADPVVALGRQGEAELAALACEEVVRDLHQDAGAVAGQWIAAARTA